MRMEQHSINSAEVKETPSIQVVYRDNVLFSKYMGALTAWFKASGYRVHEQVFPQGTPHEKIKDWVDENQSQIVKNPLIAMDGTCSEHISEKMRFRRDFSPKYVYLDDLFYAVSRRIVESNSEIGEKEKLPLDAYDSFMPGLFREFAETKRPEGVYVFTARLSDHPPFREIPKSNAAEHIKRWLVAGGIADSNIFLSDFYQGGLGGSGQVTLGDAGTQLEIDGNLIMGNPAVWVIRDRHVEPGITLEGNTHLVFPLPNLVESAIANGLYSVEAGRFEELLKEELEVRVDRP